MLPRVLDVECHCPPLSLQNITQTLAMFRGESHDSREVGARSQFQSYEEPTRGTCVATSISSACELHCKIFSRLLLFSCQIPTCGVLLQARGLAADPRRPLLMCVQCEVRRELQCRSLWGSKGAIARVKERELLVPPSRRDLLPAGSRVKWARKVGRERDSSRFLWRS